MNGLDRADRFWAAELGIQPRALHTDGFQVVARTDPESQPRATVVGTARATVVSLPDERRQVFQAAGLDLDEMERSPRRYIASCSSAPSLAVRGPAYLGYWKGPFPSATPAGLIEPLRGDALASLVSLREAAPEEWEEAGIGPNSRVFGMRVDDRVVAVAGYEPWPGQLAQLHVFCHPAYRRRGLAAKPLKAAIAEALAENLLPQYRARDDNAASIALAKRVGFVEYGWMATVRIRGT